MTLPSTTGGVLLVGGASGVEVGGKRTLKSQNWDAGCGSSSSSVSSANPAPVLPMASLAGLPSGCRQANSLLYFMQVQAEALGPQGRGEQQGAGRDGEEGRGGTKAQPCRRAMDSLHARSPARGCEQTWWLNPWPHGARAVCGDGDCHVPPEGDAGLGPCQGSPPVHQDLCKTIAVTRSRTEVAAATAQSTDRWASTVARRRPCLGPCSLPASLRGPTAALGHPSVLGQGAELEEATLGLRGVSRDRGRERGSRGSLVGAASPHLIPLVAQGHRGLMGLF